MVAAVGKLHNWGRSPPWNTLYAWLAPSLCKYELGPREAYRRSKHPSMPIFRGWWLGNPHFPRCLSARQRGKGTRAALLYNLSFEPAASSHLPWFSMDIGHSLACIMALVGKLPHWSRDAAVRTIAFWHMVLVTCGRIYDFLPVPSGFLHEKSVALASQSSICPFRTSKGMVADRGVCCMTHAVEHTNVQLAISYFT